MKATLENGITIELTQEQLASIENQMKPKKTKEQRFQELLSQIDVHQPKVDFAKYPNIIFWFDKNGNYFCEYDWKSEYFSFSYPNVWKVFETEFNLTYQEIRTFLTAMVEEYFKLKGVTTLSDHWGHRLRVEEYFKLKGVTTDQCAGWDRCTVEEYFKLKGVTTYREGEPFVVGAEGHFKFKDKN